MLLKKKLKVSLILVLLSVLTYFSCSSDENTSYSPIAIELVSDIFSTNQGTSISLNILSNDINLPNNGLLTINETLNSGELIHNTNSSDSLLDDTITYIPTNDFFGEEQFHYTVCYADGTNCDSASITITVNAISPVNFDLEEIPYPTLSDYNFFKNDLKELDPVYGVLPYKPINKLFSDYALKKRFVWMPENVKASYESDNTSLIFPNGAVLIKNFYYEMVLPLLDSKAIETRLMIKKEGSWIFANYIWNDTQTEAYLDTDGGFRPVSWLQNGVEKSTNYRIPTSNECLTCHQKETSSGVIINSIGTKPQNLNSNYQYADDLTNQLEKWISLGYLENVNTAQIASIPDWLNSSEDLQLRVRSYLDSNCAHCHSDNGYCNYRAIRLDFSKTEDPDNIGVCIDAEIPISSTLSKIVVSGIPQKSVLYYRLNTTTQEHRMPLLGRSIVHEEGVQLLFDWIQSLDSPCI